ncbi:hypothetical protein LCGC14_1884960 [marine sediment metagenome]|uniref:Phage major capsid protein n=1 Tax=marine sediment metagenome TaxID=412755 RepID=A0A0F9GPK5_9ZZZZ
MATRSLATIGNIFDVIKMKLPDGSAINSVLNALGERDDFSALVPAFPANNGLTHHSLRTISLPTGHLVDIGGSWKTSKSDREPVVEALCTIKSTYQAPIDTFTTEKPEVGRALLQAEKFAHVMTLNQSLTNLIFNGSTVPNQSGLVGLIKRAPYATHDSKFTFNVGGSGNDLRSCWLMKPGVDTLHYLYNPNHPTLGIEMKDKTGADGQLIQGLGDSSDEHRWDVFIEFMVQKGIFVRDQRALKRICNVDCGVSALPGPDLIAQIIEASIINAPTGGTMQVQADGRITDTPAPWLLMCDERLYAKLVINANEKLMVYTSDNNIYRTKLPMIGDNIIIARLDALNKDLGSGETVVAAA